MAKINPAKRVITLKVVYYGPGLSGKTTNITSLHDAFPSKQRGGLVKLDTETERTLFFDYFPAGLGTIGGFRVVVDYFSVPGQSFYNETRKVILDGTDVLIFVADSSPHREEANITSFENLQRNLAARSQSLDDLAIVFQWNKRDVKGAIPVKVLERQLNKIGAPSFEAVAFTGEGVKDTSSAALKLALEKVRSSMSRGGRR